MCGGGGDLFRTPLSIASGVLPPGSAGPGSCERGRPAWQGIGRNRWFGGLSVPVILRSKLTVIGRLGSQTPHSHSGEGDRRNGCLLCFGFCLGWWFGIWVSLKHCIAEVEFVISPLVR